MVQYNHRSLMISVNDTKYIHLLTIFRTFQSFSCCKYKPFISGLIILLQMLFKLFFSNRIIHTLQNLNKYVVLNTFNSILKWFVFIQSNRCNRLHRCWEGMGCSFFAYRTVTGVHFTDQNLISKTIVKTMLKPCLVSGV